MAVILLLAVSAVPASAAVTIRAFVLADRSVVDPGDIVSFSVSLDNAGPNAAMRAWANLTLPSGMTYQSDNANTLPPFAGTWASGNRRYYNFTSLPPGNHTFVLLARVNVGPADGAALTTRLAVNYTDETGVRQPEATAQRSVTVSIPTITVSKTPSAISVDPGDTLTYTIRVNNSGSARARTVWINESLPSEVTFVRVTPPGGCTGANCTIQNFNPGSSRTVDVQVRVKATTPRGTILLNRVFVNHTDDDGTVLAPVSRQAAVEVRTLRDLTLDKVSEASVAFPGAQVRFRVWYNNTATADLRDVWLNDTLPAGLTFDASTPAASVNGNLVQWRFNLVGPGPHAVVLVARVASTVADGTVLVNRATAEYIDPAGSRAPRVNASATLTVSVSIPLFDTFTKAADRFAVAPGGTVRYTIWYNNTGGETAAVVVVRDTIPEGTVLTNPSATPTVNGRVHEWRFTNVTLGPHSLTYVLVLQDVAGDTNLVNFASLNATDANGRPLPPVPPRSAIVQVTGAGGASSVPALAALAILLVGALGVVYYLRRPRTVIDEVFLLHKDGLLIKHYTRRVRPDVDSDVLSGMLIAVQNFVNESFLGSEGLGREGHLDELRFGEFKILIERGEWVIVAAALSGDSTDRVKGAVRAAIEDLEAMLGDHLEGWSGDMKSVEGADRYMQDLIAGRYARRPWGKG